MIIMGLGVDKRKNGIGKRRTEAVVPAKDVLNTINV